MSSLAGGCFHGEDKDPLDKIIGICFIVFICIIIYNTAFPENSPQDNSQTQPPKTDQHTN